MEQTNKSGRTFLATTPTFPGYWGRHEDSPHHAIASCCQEGASPGGIFIVHAGPASLRVDMMGTGMEWEGDPDDKPTLEGVFTASGCWLGSSLAEVAEDVRKGNLIPDEHALNRETVRALKAHKPD